MLAPDTNLPTHRDHTQGVGLITIESFSLMFTAHLNPMETRKSARKARSARPRRFTRGPKHRCAVCEEVFDSPTLSIKVNRGRAHLLCAALDRVGLRALARTSGRW